VRGGDANTYSDSDAVIADAYAYINANSDTYNITYGDAYSYGNSHGFAHSYAQGNTEASADAAPAAHSVTVVG
jgi:hypothetical protein